MKNNLSVLSRRTNYLMKAYPLLNELNILHKMMNLIACALVCFSLVFQGMMGDELDDLLDSCLDTKTHKTKPGPESQLYEQCLPWKDHACCTENTTLHVHTNNSYNFDFDHCFAQKGFSMSPLCKRHFVEDLCFYECEPHIGPWKVQVQRSFAKERFFQVPLCRSDCDSWFKACQHDFTCVSNWPRHFNFSKGRNYCPEDSICRTFTSVYKTAEKFCEDVWDGSWRVVNDDEPCMRIWFDGTRGNPNRRVAEIEIHRLKGDVGRPVAFYLLLLLATPLALVI